MVGRRSCLLSSLRSAETGRAVIGPSADSAPEKPHHKPQPHDSITTILSRLCHDYHKLHLTPSYIPKNQQVGISRLPSMHVRSPFQTPRAKDIRLLTALIVSLINVLPKCETTVSLGPRRVEVSVTRARTVLLTAHLLQE